VTGPAGRGSPARTRRGPLCLLLFFLAPAAAAADTYIYVLGIAQDGGYPQAGCYRPHCLRAWQDPGLRRLTSSIAVVDESAGAKYVFDATPDFREQLYRLHRQAPDGEYSLSGIFLTHGHIGHYTGLMHLGHEAAGASGVKVYAMPRMRQYLSTNGPWSQLVNYHNIELVAIEDGHKQAVSDHLSVTPLRVPHREEYTEAVGFLIEGPLKSALFIPDIDKWQRWDTDIRELLRTVDYALLDASFFADGELPGRAMDQIPHPFVEESLQLFGELDEQDRRKVLFIHMNHTNPLLIDGSPQQKRVFDAGFGIAAEGMRLPL